LNLVTVYLNFGAIYLNFGAKIENRVFSKGVGRGWVLSVSPRTSGRFRHRCREKIFRTPLEEEKGVNGGAGSFPRTKREDFGGTEIQVFESGVKYLNFGDTYLSFGAIYLNLVTIYFAPYI